LPSTRVYDSLRAHGVPDELAAELQANVGDILDAAVQMNDLLLAFGSNLENDIDACRRIESEVIDHLPDHLKSLNKASRELRHLLKRRRQAETGNEADRS